MLFRGGGLPRIGVPSHPRAPQREREHKVLKKGFPWPVTAMLCVCYTRTPDMFSRSVPQSSRARHIEVKTKSFQSSKNHSNHFDTDDVDNKRSSFLLQRDARSFIYFIFHISFIWYTYLLLRMRAFFFFGRDFYRSYSSASKKTKKYSLQKQKTKKWFQSNEVNLTL